MPNEEKQDLPQQAQQVVMAIQDELERADALCVVVRQLRDKKKLLQQVLQAAIAIQNESWRAEALSAVARQL